jgi:HAE1 family hydrophobic/amphiphilic exporter-1
MMAFIAMMVTGMTLNFLSIFSLLLSLGLLVDVTIVIISAITTYYRSGRFLPHEAALLVWKDFFATLLVTTLTTVWAFLPLLLASGIIGEFLKPLPIVVSSVLVGSVLVGFLIILPLMVWLLDFSAPRRVRIFLSIIALSAFSGIVYTIFSFLDITIIPVLWIIVVPIAMVIVVTAILLLRIVWRAIKELCAKKYCRFHMTMGQCVDRGLVNISRIASIYKGLLDRSLRQKNARRMIVGMVVIFFFFAVSLVGFGFVENEFFPSDDANLIYVNIELPLDTRAEISEDVARAFVSEIIGLEGVKNYQTQIGAKFSGNGEMSLDSAAHNVLITLNLLDKEERELTSLEITDTLRHMPAVTEFDKGSIVITQMGSGPPAGADVTVKLIGEDLDVLNAYADQIGAYLRDLSGVINVQKSVQSGSSKIVFVPDHAQLAEYGLSVQDVGFYLRTFGSGYVVEDGVAFDDLVDDRDIVIRLTDDVQSVDALERATLITRNGSDIPLTTLGAFEMKESPIVIEREDQKRILSVTASVEEGYNANVINTMVGDHIDNEIVLPQGYTWKTGGANEENQKSVRSILQAMVLAVILIFLTLIVQLNSYRKSFIVLLVIPLAISGVFVLFAIFGISLSFPALIGVLALFGIVINNSIMIIDQINKNHRAGIPFHEAVVEGAASRLEPITLSSLTTIVGLTPITITQPLWQGLGGAIISGLVFSGVIMLFFIPSVYYMMMEKEYLSEKVK